jgi:hypothetical protein
MTSLFVNDAHQLHPGVVLRVAPHAARLPHGDDAGDTGTFASRNEPSTPLLGVEGPVTGPISNYSTNNNNNWC